jgi:hypothetical protein
VTLLSRNPRNPTGSSRGRAGTALLLLAAAAIAALLLQIVTGQRRRWTARARPAYFADPAPLEGNSCGEATESATTVAKTACPRRAIRGGSSFSGVSVGAW